MYTQTCNKIVIRQNGQKEVLTDAQFTVNVSNLLHIKVENSKGVFTYFSLFENDAMSLWNNNQKVVVLYGEESRQGQFNSVRKY